MFIACIRLRSNRNSPTRSVNRRMSNGGRDGECAKWFIDDVAKRLATGVDGLKAYLEAVEGAFGADVDYAQLVKLYQRMWRRLCGCASHDVLQLR